MRSRAIEQLRQMSLALPTGCAIVCHDAGAANIILSWAKAKPDTARRFYVSGPAARIFENSALDATPCSSIEEVLEGASMLLSGTGWSSSVEHNARRLARSRELRTVAVIDHWVNFRTRFERDGQTVLPNEFWVTDTQAFDRAQAEFPEALIVLQPNLYVDEVLRDVSRVTAPEHTEILFILEPLRGDIYTNELQVLDYFLSALHKLSVPQGTRIMLRPHPSEPDGKYDAWIQAHSHLDVKCESPHEPLATAIGRATIVVGCHSFALVLALKAGKRVICALPPWSQPCALPFSEIEYLSRL